MLDIVFYQGKHLRVLDKYIRDYLKTVLVRTIVHYHINFSGFLSN